MEPEASEAQESNLMRQPTTTVHVGNVWTTVDDPKVLDIVKQLEGPLEGGPGLTSCEQPAFFTGLLPLLSDAVDLIVDDQRVPPCKFLSIPSFVDRDYQIAAVQAAVNKTRGVITIPTGGGKTRVAAGIIGSLPCSWLYIVHRSTLVEQAAKSISALLREEVGLVTANHLDFTKRITCATFDALASAKYADLKVDQLQRVEGIIVDEAHKIPARTYLGVSINTDSAYYRIGLSATPFMREDSKDIHTVAILGPEIYNIDPQTLASNDQLVLPEVKWISVEQESEFKRWPTVYDDLVVNSNIRNNEIVDAIARCEKPAIVFVKEIEHGNELARLIKAEQLRYASKIERNVIVSWVAGVNTLRERNNAIVDLKVGKISVLIATNIFSEGLDVPNLRSVFNCTGEASWKEAIQRLGRGTRPSDDKQSFTLYDFNDSGNKSLTEHTVQRYLAYRAAGFKVEPPTVAAAWRAAVEDKRLSPTLKKTDALTKQHKGSLILLGIFGPIVTAISWLLFHLSKGR